MTNFPEKRLDLSIASVELGKKFYVFLNFNLYFCEIMLLFRRKNGERNCILQNDTSARSMSWKRIEKDWKIG